MSADTWVTEDSWKMERLPGWFSLLSRRALAVTTRFNNTPADPRHCGTSLWPWKASCKVVYHRQSANLARYGFVTYCFPLLNSKSYRKEEKKESGLVFFIIGWGFFRFFWIGLFFLLGEVWGFLSVEKLTRLKVEKHLNTFFAVNPSFQVLSVLGGKSSILTWLRHAMLKSYSCRQNYEQWLFHYTFIRWKTCYLNTFNILEVSGPLGL